MGLVPTPVLGRVPKRHLDSSRPDIASEGRFWRGNLPRLIASGFGEQAPDGFTYTETDQFRDGPDPLT